MTDESGGIKKGRCYSEQRRWYRCDEMRQQAGSEQTGIYLQNSQCAGHSICTRCENVVTMMTTREYHSMTMMMDGLSGV
jgi:hypothetical protein